MLRRGRDVRLEWSCLQGEFPISIFDVVLSGYTIRGSIVGHALGHGRKPLAFAAEGKVQSKP